MSESEKSKYADSAGVPWEGRSFSQNQFAHDDGKADSDLILAIQDFQGGEKGLADVVASFAKARLLIPLLANLASSEQGQHGLEVDKSAELAIVTVQTPDNQSALPVFSSVSAMAKWNSAARPVPNFGRAIALAAASEGNTRIVLDPGSVTELVIRRPAIAAIAQGFTWVSPEANSEVERLVSEIIAKTDKVKGFSLSSGDPEANLSGQELVISLYLQPGLSKTELVELETSLFSGLSAQEQFVELVDSVAIRYLPAS